MPSSSMLQCPKRNAGMQAGRLLERGHGDAQAVTGWHGDGPGPSSRSRRRHPPNALERRTGGRKLVDALGAAAIELIGPGSPRRGEGRGVRMKEPGR